MVSRAKKTMRFPAQFMLVAAMNPCPCGYFGSTLRGCKCTPTQVTKYMAKVSGPLVDRIDIHIDVPAVAFGKLRSRDQQVSSQTLCGMVAEARQRQARRFGQGQLMTNSRMSHRQLEAFCKLDETSEMMLKAAMMELGLSARAHDKICKVARTIADLEGSDDIQAEHVGEAIGYRKLDRKL
jgi:magnesium chelatase family protein